MATTNDWDSRAAEVIMPSFLSIARQRSDGSATFCIRVSGFANEDACLRIEIVACGDLDEERTESLPAYPSLGLAAEVDDTRSRPRRTGAGWLGRHRGWAASAVGIGLLAAIVLLFEPASPGVAASPAPTPATPSVAVASSAPLAVEAFRSSDSALLTGDGWIGGLYRDLDCHSLRLHRSAGASNC